MGTDASVLAQILDDRTLQELLLVVKDAGVEYFRLGELEVRFLAPQPAAAQNFVVPADRGVKGQTEGPQSPYHKLFAGKAPRLGTESES